MVQSRLLFLFCFFWHAFSKRVLQGLPAPLGGCPAAPPCPGPSGPLGAFCFVWVSQAADHLHAGSSEKCRDPEQKIPLGQCRHSAWPLVSPSWQKNRGKKLASGERRRDSPDSAPVGWPAVAAGKLAGGQRKINQNRSRLRSCRAFLATLGFSSSLDRKHQQDAQSSQHGPAPPDTCNVHASAVSDALVENKHLLC